MAKKIEQTTKERRNFFSSASTDKDIERFKNLTKKLDSIYDTESGLAAKIKHRTTNRALFNIRSKSDLANNINSLLDTPGALAEISRLLHSVDPNYQKIISYYADMYYTRYTVTPVKIKTKNDEIDKEAFMEMYNGMMEVVDGLSLEVLIPAILEEIFVSGSCFISTEKNNAAKTISTLILPANFSRTTLKTNLGTNIVEFDFKYFDSFTKQEDLDFVLTIFPSEFSILYRQYKEDTNANWKQLDPRYSTSFSKNTKGIPPLLNSLDGILEYEQVRKNEAEKSDNELKSIFVHQIPVDGDGVPIFDMTEVAAIQGKISQITRNHSGLDSITVFGRTELLKLQDEGKAENKRIEQAYKTIYNSAGLNANIFAGTIAESLKINLQTDKALVWRLIKNIENFINLAVNSWFKFKGYQSEISMMPITIYDEQEKVESYLSRANYGIGKMEAIISSGIKQKHIHDKFVLEKMLGLDEILIPLQSSHTTSAAGINVKNKDTAEAKEENNETNEVDETNDTGDENE